ncbi:MAG: hypothetical protein AAF614_35645 [Chloroflexota bacterium]
MLTHCPIIAQTASHYIFEIQPHNTLWVLPANGRFSAERLVTRSGRCRQLLGLDAQLTQATITRNPGPKTFDPHFLKYFAPFRFVYLQPE